MEIEASKWSIYFLFIPVFWWYLTVETGCFNFCINLTPLCTFHIFQAYVTICDLLIVFSKHMSSNAVLVPLIYEPDRNMQQQLSGFLNEKVFIDDEEGE